VGWKAKGLLLLLPLFYDVTLSEAKDLRFARSSNTAGCAHYLRHPDNHLPTHYAQAMRDRCYCTYITASRTHVLYVGVTGNIELRIAQHKKRKLKGFTAAYHCDRLVWFERHTSPTAAIAREKELKGWRRAKKIELIERENSTWTDLSENCGQPIPIFQP
jgi:putative endonuclease